MLAEEPADGLRVLVFGASATAGLGLSPNVTFARYLERMLHAAPPERTVEVLNLGAIAISSDAVKVLVTDVWRNLVDGFVWLVNIDLSKFFDRVHHQRLLSSLAKRVSDKRVLKLVHRCLKAKVGMPDGVRMPTDEGTPQGGPQSPLLSNVVLDELDWELVGRRPPHFLA